MKLKEPLCISFAKTFFFVACNELLKVRLVFIWFSCIVFANNCSVTNLRRSLFGPDDVSYVKVLNNYLFYIMMLDYIYKLCVYLVS